MSSHLLNDLGNFHETFRKDVTYDNIKSHKKPGFHTVIIGEHNYLPFCKLPSLNYFLHFAVVQ